jgi:hypothetical protein
MYRFGRTATRCHTFVANRQLRAGINVGDAES